MDASATKRLLWVDAARGIGILAVALGHASAGALHEAIYFWHMPFFFFLSGFVYRTQETFYTYAKHRARQLLVPYFLWLVAIMLPTFLGELRLHDPAVLGERLRASLFGGSMLAGPTAAFWFLTSLYVSLLVYDALSRWTGRWIHLACLALVALAYLRSAFIDPRLYFVWEFDALLIAVPFLHVGRLARKFDLAENRPVLAFGTAIFVLVCFASHQGCDIPVYDVKAGRYGIPIVSFGLALAGIAAVLLVAKAAGPLTLPLTYIGRASLVIVVVHMAVYVALARTAPQLPMPVAFGAGVGIPLALYPLLRSRAWSRRYLLGEAWAERPPARVMAAIEPPERNPVSDAVAEP